MALNEKQLLIGIGVTTLLISGGLAYLSYQTTGEIQTQQEEAAGLRNRISAAQAKIDKIRTLEDDVLILRENVQEYVKILPDDREVTEFLKKLSDIGESIGVDSTQFDPQKSTTRGLFEPVTYKVRISGTVWQILTYLNRVESQKRFMVVPKIKISPGAPRLEELDFENVRHDAELEIQTFRYNPKGGASETPIIREEQRIAALQERIHQERRALSPQEPYVFAGARNRRDPFIDPRIPKDGDRPGPSIAEQQDVYAALRDRVDTLEQDYVRYQERVTKLIVKIELYQQMRTTIKELDAQFAETEQSGVFTYLPLRSKFNSLKQRYAELKASFQNMDQDGGLSMTLKELKVAYEKMRRLLHSGDLDAVNQEFVAIRDRLGASRPDSKKRVWVEEIEQLAHKAQVAREFRTKDIRITGTGIMDTGAAAVINGRAVAEGELLEDELVVSKVHKDSIEFLFKGVLIVKKR